MTSNKSELYNWAIAAASWYCTEFDRRTEAVKTGEANIDWIDPEWRICWSETLHHCPPPPSWNAVDVRIAFDVALKMRRQR